MKATGNHSQFRVERDNRRPLAFKGELLASVSSCVDHGRWTELKLYRTIGGQYICQRAFMTQLDGEPDNREAEVFNFADAVIDFFGLGSLAADLYAEAGIDIAYWVD